MSTALIKDSGDTLELGAFKLAKTGLVVVGTPTAGEWQECGRLLRRIEGAVQFWIGDWVNYGDKAYGEKYDEAERITGLDYNTLANYAWVASKVESSSRDENLGYKIHEAVATLPPHKQAEILARAEAEDLTVSKVRDLVRAETHNTKVALIASGQLLQGEFDVIAADPPWQYDNSGFHQAAASHYPTMDVDAIAALPQTDRTFPKFASPSVLFLWATSPLLPAAVRVMEAWGFDYKACAVWVKDHAPGMGWWLNTRHELLLIGARGQTTPLEKVDSVITAPVGEHSRKPAEAYDVIDRMYPPGLRRVEVFARTARDGWEVWGNEV